MLSEILNAMNQQNNSLHCFEYAKNDKRITVMVQSGKKNKERIFKEGSKQYECADTVLITK